MKRFKVNEFVELQLEEGKTVIYIAGESFQQCKYLLLDIPVEKISTLDGIESIDEAAERLDKSLENRQNNRRIIPPEVEFWGHCSNLQAWSENNYDTRLLHSNISFPLLKRLTEKGDSKAKKVFKDEIIKRLAGQNVNVIKYLILENYLEHFTNEEFGYLLENDTLNFLENILKCNLEVEVIHDLLIIFESKAQISFSKRIRTIFEKQDYSLIDLLIFFLNRSKSSTIVLFLKDLNINFLETLENSMNNTIYLIPDINGFFAYIDENIMRELKKIIIQSYENNNEEAIKCILKFGLTEMIDEKDQSYLLKKLNLNLLDSVICELGDQRIKSYMPNIGDRIFRIKQMKNLFIK